MEVRKEIKEKEGKVGEKGGGGGGGWSEEEQERRRESLHSDKNFICVLEINKSPCELLNEEGILSLLERLNRNSVPAATRSSDGSACLSPQLSAHGPHLQRPMLCGPPYCSPPDILSCLLGIEVKSKLSCSLQRIKY